MTTKTFYKKCSKCCRTKRCTLFYKCISGTLGLNSWCKKCHSAYSKTPKRREKGKFFCNRYLQTNRAKSLASARNWKNKNKEKVKEYWKKYYEENRERLVFRATKATYVRRGAVGDFTKDDISTLLDKQNGVCVYCTKPLEKYHVDHIVPISKGGTSWPSNIQLTCAFCNHSKKDRDRPVTIPA